MVLVHERIGSRCSMVLILTVGSLMCILQWLCTSDKYQQSVQQAHCGFAILVAA
jgi:hypothetical protein